MTTMNISLPEPMCDWVNDQINSGHFATNSDYVRDLIRKDQVRMQKIEAMQSAIDEGLASGIVENFDPETFKQKLIEKARAQL